MIATAFNRFANHIKNYANLVVLSHALFALPFALVSAIESLHHVTLSTRVQIQKISLIILCVILARNVAMSFNRIVDRHYDALNPRTQNRELVNGTLSVKSAQIFCFMNALFFWIATYFINTISFYLAPLALGIVCFYSLTKRFTASTQIFLGLALGIAPPSASIAIQGFPSLFSCLLGLAVLFWVAGFDLIYSTQDYDYDRKHNLKNLVVSWGIAKALFISRLFHSTCICILLIAGTIAHRGLFFFIGTLVMAVLLVYEHRLIRPDKLTHVNKAFFTINGIVSVLFLFFNVIDEIFL